MGKTVTYVAAWLKNKPDEVDLEGKFFAVLDKKAVGEKDESGNEKGNKIVLCRIGGKKAKIIQCNAYLCWRKKARLHWAGWSIGILTV